MHFESSDRAEIHGAVRDHLPESSFFSSKIQSEGRECCPPDYRVKTQQECKGWAVDTVSVTNKLLINLDLEGTVRV